MNSIIKLKDKSWYWSYDRYHPNAGNWTTYDLASHMNEGQIVNVLYTNDWGPEAGIVIIPVKEGIYEYNASQRSIRL